VNLDALEVPRVVTRVLGQLIGLVGQLEGPGRLILRLLRLLVGLLRIFLSLLRALVGLVGLVLRLLSLLGSLVGLIVCLLRVLAGLVGLVLRLLSLLGGLRRLVVRLLGGLVGLVGLVVRLPRSVVRLLRAAPRLLGLLTRTVRLVQSQLNPVANSLQIVVDGFACGQLPQLLLVLVQLAVLASWLCCSLDIVCLGHVTLLIFAVRCIPLHRSRFQWGAEPPPVIHRVGLSTTQINPSTQCEEIFSETW